MPTNVFRPLPRPVLKRIAEETVSFFDRAVASKSPPGLSLQAAIEGTRLYSPNDQPPLTPGEPFDTQYQVTRERTCSAILRLSLDGCESPVALVFSSAKNPGGGFLNGAAAQEESVCRCSGLYLCLKGNEMYTINRGNTDKSCLYISHAIYSPGVPIIRDSEKQTEMLDEFITSAFITAPAPNSGVARRRGATEEEIKSVLEERIRMILAIAHGHGHKELILGAFGCGVFGNDPNVVAATFHKELEGGFKGLFRKVVFAVLDRENGPNYTAFQKMFPNEEGSSS